jgi:hypothetical protein
MIRQETGDRRQGQKTGDRRQKIEEGNSEFRSQESGVRRQDEDRR